MAYQHPSHSQDTTPDYYQARSVGARGPGAGANHPVQNEFYNSTQFSSSAQGSGAPIGPALRTQSQRRPPPQGGYEYGPVAGLQRGMRSMTMDDRQPPNLHAAPESYRNHIYGGEPGFAYDNDHSGSRPRGTWDQPHMSQHRHDTRGRADDPYSSQRIAPRQPLGWEQQWDSNGIFPVYETHTQVPQSAPSQGVQRSMTMPSSVSHPGNVPQHRVPMMSSAPHHESNAIETRAVGRVLEPDWRRESVGAFLDSYYDPPGPGPEEQPGVEDIEQTPTSHPHLETDESDRSGPAQRSGTGAVVPKPNFSRPHPLTESRPLAQQNVPQFDREFGSPLQAHKVQSQPDMRNTTGAGGGYGYGPSGGGYNGAVEMPADVPPLATYNGFQSVRTMPPLSPGIMNSAVTDNTPMRYPRRVDSVPHRLGSVPPSSAGLQIADSSLPIHPGPEILGASGQYTNHNYRLPAHPPPIRPGLINDGNHPPPQRQYDMESSNAPFKGEQGPVTHQELEQLAHAVKMNPGDPKLHLTYAKKLVEAATVLASDNGRADVKTTRKNRENFIYEAHKIIKKLTNASNPYPEAIFYLASCYGEGLLGLQIDHEKAYNLYQSAAKLGHGPSAYRTAVCSELGAGVRRDPAKAITWYKKAAAIGETPAMFKLGMIQWKGLLGQPRNPRDGLIWLKRAADQADENNQHALHELALIYERSEGSDVVIRDVNYARELFTRAAELGYPASQFRMGSAYEYGTMGCPIDPKKSIAWYSKAAMKGDLESQLALSGWYLTGSEGVLQQSDTEAYLWARKAAERGLSKAEYALGYFTEVGIGVVGNLEEAKRWYYKAASQGHPKAQLRLQELKRGGTAAAQKSRERLSRSNVKHRDEGDCVLM